MYEDTPCVHGAYISIIGRYDFNLVALLHQVFCDGLDKWRCTIVQKNGGRELVSTTILNFYP